MPALLRGGSYQEYVHKVANQTLGKLFYEVWMDDYPQEKKEWEYLPVLTVTSFRKK